MNNISTTSSSSDDANRNLDSLLNEIRRLAKDFNEAIEKYSNDSNYKALFAGILIDHFEIPDNISDRGLAIFFKKWESTPDYKRLRDQFESNYDRIKAFLSEVSEATKTIRYPGNSRKLLMKLKSVNEAVRLDTKIRRLLMALEDIDLRNLVYNRDLPKKRERHRATPLKKTHNYKAIPSERSETHYESQAWILFSIFIPIVVTVALTLALTTPLGWIWGLIIAIVFGLITVVIIAVTRRIWVPAFIRLLKK